MIRLADRVAVRIAIAVVVTFYAVLGLVVLKPEGLYSGDVGVKYVQARALAESKLRSLDLPYPGAFLDPSREFFPLRPPFVMTVGGETQAIFQPATAILHAGPAVVAGVRGLTIVSLISSLIILIAVAALAADGLKTVSVIAVGLASPLWAYAVLGFEHAPAIACSTMAFAAAVRWQHARRYLLAGLLLGAGALLRDEVIVLMPGLLWVVWLRERAWRPVASTLAGLLAPLGAGMAMDVWWFGRPPAAHLRHAVDVLTASVPADAADLAVPTLQHMSFRERYEVVIWYWLVGYGHDVGIASFTISFVVALAIYWRLRSPTAAVPMLMWVLAVLALASYQAWDLVTAPKWLAGMHRVAPYLVLALLPWPSTNTRRDWLPWALVATVGIFVAVAFATTNTSGGKSLGPRLLMPLLPLLAVAAVWRIASYVQARATVERAIGYVGGALILLTIVTHAAGTVPAYFGRNQDDSAAVRTAAHDPARVVVADDPFTAQLLFPLFYRKIIFLADTAELRAKLGALLLEAKVTDVLLISRRPEPGMRLSPLRLNQSDKVGRMYIQYWGRVGRER